MDFNQFVESKKAKAFRGPRRFTVSSTTEPLPHEAGALSKGLNRSRSGANNSRAKESPTIGEVVGRDAASGDALVRQPGNRVVRVEVADASVGNTVSVSRDEAIDSIRKRGAVSSVTQVSNSGWKPVSGRPSVERLSATFSQEVENLELLGDPCTPPDVKIALVEAAIDIGMAVNAQGQAIGYTRDIRTGLSLDNEASRETGRLLQQLYEQEKAAGKQQQTLNQVISLDSLGGTGTAGLETPSIPALWRCVNGTCIQDTQGFFASREECEQTCGGVSYNCVNGQCVEVRGPSGQFANLQACIEAPCNTRWACVNGEPVPSRDGPFISREDAVANGCFWGYDFNGVSCQPSIGGQFPSLQCCLELGSNPPLQSWASATASSDATADNNRERTLTLSDGAGGLYSLINDPDNNIQLQGLLDHPTTLNLDFDNNATALQGAVSTTNLAVDWLLPVVERQCEFTVNLVQTYWIGTRPLPSTRAEVEAEIGTNRYVEDLLNIRRNTGIPSRRVNNLFQQPRTWLAEINAPNSTLTFEGMVTAYQAGTVSYLPVSRFPYTASIGGDVFNERFGFDQDNVSDSTNFLQVFTDFNVVNGQQPFSSFTTFTRTEDGNNFIVVTWPPVTFRESGVQVPNYQNQFLNNTNYRLALDAESKPPGCFEGKFWQTNSGKLLVDQDQWGVDYQSYTLDFKETTNAGSPNSSARSSIQASIAYTAGSPLSSPFVWERRGQASTTIDNAPVLGNAASWRSFAQRVNNDPATPGQSTAFPSPANCNDA